LQRTLECATKQTYDNIEILVSDNCSTDHTSEIVCSFSDPRIKYHRQKENLGAYGNWNFLLNEAKGDYFHMYHDDDRIDEDFIETCMKGADYRDDLALIMTGNRIIDQEGNVLSEKLNTTRGLPLEDLILSWYEGQVNIFFCSSLFNTKILREIGGFEHKYDHYIDVAAQIKCAASGKRVDIPDVKASFRHHQGSITSKSNAHIDNWVKDSKTLLDLALSLAPAKSREIKKAGMKRSAMNVYLYGNEIESKIDRAKAFFKVYKEFGFKHLPPLKYANELIPFLGYLLHPYRAMSLLKWKVLNRFKGIEVTGKL
jgi:glycosyltransferase involved in cell wall biosynthesis